MTALTPDRLPASAAVTIEGGLLSADLIGKIREGDRELLRIAPADYGLPRGERLTDAASRKWNYLKVVYSGFRAQLADHPGNVSTTKLTREQWLYILLNELGYGRPASGPRKGIEVPGRSDRYPVSHEWQSHLPVHLLAWDTPLDRATGPGAGKSHNRAPQSMLQELLNVSDTRLWGLLSNGRALRVLRDSTALVGSSYVEFDLEAIFEGDLFSDFLLLFTLLHASRFELTPKPDRRRRAAVPADVAEADGEAGAEEDVEEGETASGAALGPADCPLEWWRQHSVETGIRARDHLRDQVKQALGILGTGFLEANPKLGEALARGGRRALDDFHHELLRLAYQLIFLFVAEDRGALLDPKDEASVARARYAAYFSTARLRRIASRRKGDRNTDLWCGLVRVLDALGKDGGREELALPGLGGLYFRTEDDPRATALLPGSPEPLRTAELSNEHLLDAIRLLARVSDGQGRRIRVDYRHLGADELGSVYESLLELVARRRPGTNTFWLQDLAAGSKRKTTGSYYTPAVLIEKLLDNALDPVIARHAASGNPDDLLNIRFVDPSCGSGHVLVAAARRIALRYAVMYTGEDEPAPDVVRDAMAKVVRACVHGVDINPLAAEIAKVSLWLESLRPGEPLAYLDDRIKVGDALLGTTPLLLEGGLPDGAFKKLTGDAADVVKQLKALNKRERPHEKKGSQHVLTEPLVHTGTADLRVKAESLASLPDRTLAQIREHARQHREFERDPAMAKAKKIADAWCAAFLWRKHAAAPPAITSATLHDLEEGFPLQSGGEGELEKIVTRNRFFHWHLEFPRVFRVEDREAADANPDTGWQGGFDCVLGNPPWERVKIQEKEWFAARDGEIADAANASERKKAIQALLTSTDENGAPVEADRQLHADFQTALREAAGTTVMLRDSGIFPLTGTGDVNMYAVFAEKARTLLAPEGMSGLVLPTGIATDKTTSGFFRDLVEKRQLVTVLDLENEEKLFPAVTNRVAFCLFTVCGPALRYERVRLAFRARRPEQLDDREFTLDAEGFKHINPNTWTAPVCEGPDQLRALEGIHRRVPVLWSKFDKGAGVNPWGLRFLRMLDMATDSKSFLTQDVLAGGEWTLNGTVFVKGEERYLPLYEGKFAHHYDGRFATYEGATQAQINKGTLPRLEPEDHADPSKLPLPRYWVHEALVEDRLAGEPLRPETEWPHDWLMGWRDVCRSSDVRTVIPSVVPRTAMGHTEPLLLPTSQSLPLYGLLANLSSVVLDFAARQKISGAHLTYTYLEQLPALTPDTYDTPVPWLDGTPPAPWIRDRVLELTYTSYEMGPWAEYLGDGGPPFVWDEERRFAIRAELDAAYLHLYGIPREDLPIILNSFRAFRNKNPDLFHATNAAIIRAYEAMAEGPYVSELTPPPVHGPRHAPGTSPLTRPRRPVVPPQPEAVEIERADEVEPPRAHDGLFGISEVGGDEQLGFWG